MAYVLACALFALSIPVAMLVGGYSLLAYTSGQEGAHAYLWPMIGAFACPFLTLAFTLWAWHSARYGGRRRRNNPPPRYVEPY
jgi:hypothetical protein